MTYKPGQNRVLIVSMTGGIPERKRFYTIEYLGDKIKEIAFFADAESRDYVLGLLQLGDRLESDTGTWCAFCGGMYPQGTPKHGDGALAEHIKVCPEHPMRAVEAERERLAVLVQGALDAWDGSDNCMGLWQRMDAWERSARPGEGR